MEENKKYTTKDVEEFLGTNLEENSWFQAEEKFGIELIDELLNSYKKYNEEQSNYYWIEMMKEQNERLESNAKEIENVKTLIDYDFSFIEEFLDESNDWWKHVGYVEVVKSDSKNCFYPNNDLYVEKDSEKSLYYMHQDDSEENTFHNLVYQRDGGYGDLFIYKNNVKSLKII